VRVPLPPAAEFACRATADASVTGGMVARPREFRGLRPGRRERQAKSAGRPAALPAKEFFVMNHKLSPCR